MKGNKTSKTEKHEHAVIVCSIIGKKGNVNRNQEKRLISDLIERESSRPDKSITDKIREPLNFGKIHDNFLSNNYLRISEERKRKKDRDKKIDPDYPILGEYLKYYKKIILYINNIEDYIRKIKGFVDKDEKNNLIITTYIHELFHAYFHFVTGQSIFRQHRYNYILEIEEAITEFCTLVYINNIKSGNPEWSNIFKSAYINILEKQKSKGDLSAYGFGAYLFDNIKKENERLELINKYIHKLGNIDESDKKVNEYIERVREPNNYEECVNLLNDILEPSAN